MIRGRSNSIRVNARRPPSNATPLTPSEISGTPAITRFSESRSRAPRTRMSTACSQSTQARMVSSRSIRTPCTPIFKASRTYGVRNCSEIDPDQSNQPAKANTIADPAATAASSRSIALPVETITGLLRRIWKCEPRNRRSLTAVALFRSVPHTLTSRNARIAVFITDQRSSCTILVGTFSSTASRSGMIGRPHPRTRHWTVSPGMYRRIRRAMTFWPRYSATAPFFPDVCCETFPSYGICSRWGRPNLAPRSSVRSG